MNEYKQFDVIIIGGSYAGLSAALGLGRALRKVLVIDNGKPCNRQTPNSHNFLTHDGKKPSEINQLAKKELENYETVSFYDGLVNYGAKTDKGFIIKTKSDRTFDTKKLVFATGIKDIMPDINGFKESWGISIIHCPYCHGYEVRNKKTGIFGNGEYGFEFSKLINNWTEDLTLYTDGTSELTSDQTKQLSNHNIQIVEKDVTSFNQNNGYINHILFKDGTISKLEALYAKAPFIQNSEIPKQLGCEINEMGYITIDNFQKTTVPGVYACGDNTSFMRSVANAVSMGTTTAGILNKELIDEEWN
ncbi:NAD(P)/FAD-dependent oxidoreductase [uncultured Aquimarina sp.]|uniref:NAD(P)/FAD-dependent oxidoreductase n=1 Tax=uncultured Aquimarina sp. TaxID=575652 RepID=UPI00261688B1|nr:NAD(P)/FAD-dependent oxidoreductase [uncultured Aquimarina sp.]